MTYADIQPLVSTLIEAATPAALVAAAWVVNKAVTVAHDKFNLDFDTAAVKNVHDAAQTAAGHVMNMLARGVITMPDIHALAPSIVALAVKALNAVGDSADAVGVNAPDMAHMIVGRVGAMVSADNTMRTLPAATTYAVVPTARAMPPQPASQTLPVAGLTETQSHA